MKYSTSLLATWRFTLQGRLSKVLAIGWAVFCYLVEPDAAFIAVMVLVALDFITKLTAISVRRGGVIGAVSKGHISSKAAFTGTCVKLIAYFALGVLAVQVKYVAQSDTAAILSKTVIYGFLFMVEAISIIENLVEAGLKSLTPLLNRLRDQHVRKETDL